MVKILIIGAGQLGSRHLQGLLKSKLQLDIEVYDISEASLEGAKIRANEILQENELKKVEYFNSISKVSKRIDICIVSTVANIRINVVEQLLSQSVVETFIMEKILFQKINDFNQFEKLLIVNNSKVFVNCPRRTFNFYKEIKEKISTEKNLKIYVSGGEWGMASNAIHFADLFQFFTSCEEIKIDYSGLEEIIPSKRIGYQEIVGNLKFSLKNKLMELISMKMSDMGIIINIQTENFHWIIDERNLKIKFSSRDNSWKEIETEIVLPFQSDLTNVFVEEIVETNSSSLPEYFTSKIAHLALIGSLKKYFEKNSILCKNGIPVT